MQPVYTEVVVQFPARGLSLHVLSRSLPSFLSPPIKSRLEVPTKRSIKRSKNGNLASLPLKICSIYVTRDFIQVNRSRVFIFSCRLWIYDADVMTFAAIIRLFSCILNILNGIVIKNVVNLFGFAKLPGCMNEK